MLLYWNGQVQRQQGLFIGEDELATLVRGIALYVLAAFPRTARFPRPYLLTRQTPEGPPGDEARGRVTRPRDRGA